MYFWLEIENRRLENPREKLAVDFSVNHFFILCTFGLKEKFFQI